MSATPRPSYIEENVDHILNFALANPSDLGDLCGLTIMEIEAAVRYARHAINTFEEVKAALEEAYHELRVRCGYTDGFHAYDTIKAVLARMSG